MKTLIILALAVVLSGCGWYDRKVASLAGYSTICVKETGVIYVQFASGATILLDRDGKPVACK